MGIFNGIVSQENKRDFILIGGKVRLTLPMLVWYIAYAV